MESRLWGKCQSPLVCSGLPEKLSEMSTKLEAIQKALDMYLETKRQIFPRFYFLSNDDVLEILGQSQNPAAMQPHLKKCFDNIKSLRIEEAVSLDKHHTHTHIQCTFKLRRDQYSYIWLCPPGGRG